MTTATITPTTQPSWCDDHAEFSDGSANWHKSSDATVAGSVLFLTTGSTTGEVEVEIGYRGMSLDDAEALGNALLELVKAARA